MLKPEVPVRQGPTRSGIQRVPHSEGQSKPVTQQLKNKGQSELAQTRAQSKRVRDKKKKK